MSKDLKPKRRIGQAVTSRKRKAILAVAGLAIAAGAGYAAYSHWAVTEVEVPTARARKGEFVISVRARGEIKSTRSVILSAPQVPDLTIVKLADSGKPIKKGDIVVQFDAAAQEQALLERTTTVRTADSEIVQTKASHKIIDEMDSMNLMQSEYNVERAKLEASKAEILSEIEGAKNRIEVTVAEGDLKQVDTTIQSHKISQQADIDRLSERKQKAARDMERTRGYLSKMVVRAPNDGIVNLLPNYRSQGSWGQMPPPFKEGDSAWTGASIAEIPDLSEMRVELRLDEVDRGKLSVHQPVRIRVDAIPDREFHARLNWISPIAELVVKGFRMTEKIFPAHGLLAELDPRLRPGMSATADIIIESQPNVLLIPSRASFLHNGKPAVYVQKGLGFQIRQIEVGKRNDNDIVVLSGLQEGELVTLENPEEAAKRAKKF
jgi:HlyD family secretion protein